MKTVSRFSARIGFAIVACLAVSAVSAQPAEPTQTCNSLIKATTPATRYDFSVASGAALDVQLNLMWQRCPLGYQLNDGGTPGFLDDDQCDATSTAEFFWDDALLAAEAHNSGGGLGGFTDWRLPNAHELATVVERRCHHPAVNFTVFPNTGDFLLFGNFWSATPLLEQGFQFVGPRARGWNFRLGTTVRSPIDPDGPFGREPQAVRLVRDP
ncbi:MAG: DUF1566 domain-containing protein [Lysobacterales bacterium]